MLIFFACVIVYLFSGGIPTTAMSDYAASTFLPFSILLERDFDLDEYVDTIPKGDDEHHYALNKDGHIAPEAEYVSRSPIGVPILALPVYALSLPFASLSVEKGEIWRPSINTAVFLGKLSASIITALSVLFVYLAATHLARKETALFVAVLYAFGTVTWPISSRALWQHGGAQLSLAIALYALMRAMAGKGKHALGLAGFAASYAVVCRPSMILPWFILLMYVLLVHGKKVVQYVLFSTPPALFLMWYNVILFGAPWRTGYGGEALRWTGPFFEGMAGLLFSPSRGLFVYTPAFILCILSIALMVRRWKESRSKYYLALCAVSFGYIVLMAKWWCWWGGWSWGYRMLVDISPALVLLALPAIQFLEKIKLRWIAVSLVVVSIGINALRGAEPRPLMGWVWNVPALEVSAQETVGFRRMLWNWKHSPMSCQAVGFVAETFGVGREPWAWYNNQGEGGFWEYFKDYCDPLRAGQEIPAEPKNGVVWL